MNRRRELEEARKRIEQARYDDILSAGNAVLKSRRDINSSINRFESGIHHKYDLNNIEDDMYDKKKRVGIGHEHDYYNYWLLKYCSLDCFIGGTKSVFEEIISELKINK